MNLAWMVANLGTDALQVIQRWIVPVEGRTLTTVVPTALRARRVGEFPSQLDHFKCYEVVKGERIGAVVFLKDQFGVENHVVVGTPKFFCVPVEKSLAGAVLPIQNSEDHLTVYEIMPRRRLVIDQFLAEGQGQLEFAPCEMLCVPSRKEFTGVQE